MEKVVHKNGNKSYCPLLDVTKLIFSLVIVVYHYNYFVLNWQNEKMFGGGYLSVEVFFVISGFLLGKSICKQQKIEVIPLTVNKAKKVWLPYAIALTTLFIALFRTCTDLIGLIFQFIKELLMVQEIIPFYTNNEINGPTWYISAMLVATAIIVGIKKMLPKAGDIAITALSLFCFL